MVTARAPDGRPLGLTVNSFSSVSLNPPLILWSLSRQAPSCPDFCRATHFAVNVLEARQHHLSRQFSTPLPDKFGGVEFADGPARVPLLTGVIALFVCRKVWQYDGGDHIILVGEVEHYKYNEGEPLVFHSGRYRIATRHLRYCGMTRAGSRELGGSRQNCDNAPQGGPASPLDTVWVPVLNTRPSHATRRS